MEDLKEYEYNILLKGFYDYGLNVAYLVLYEFERLERYESCNTLNQAIIRYCEEIKIQYKKQSEQEILENYASDFHVFNSSGNTALQNLPIYKNNFRALFLTIHCEKIHRQIEQSLK